MHSYLRAIGFSRVKRNIDANTIIEDIKKNYDHRIVVTNEDGYMYMELYKDYGDNIGITVCGEYDENRKFQAEYYFPYFRGSRVSSKAPLTIEKKIGCDAYVASCEDLKLDVSIVFHVQNGAEFISESKKAYEIENPSVTLSGLSKEGSILLPVKKDIHQAVKEKLEVNERAKLIRAAREGDESALQSLSIKEMDKIKNVNDRVKKEDVYTIVDTYCIPYGLECDRYHIMGHILKYKKVKNTFTNELLYQMQIQTNFIVLDICISSVDLLGVPEIGRRFKGIVWFQGNINFSALNSQ